MFYQVIWKIYINDLWMFKYRTTNKLLGSILKDRTFGKKEEWYDVERVVVICGKAFPFRIISHDKIDISLGKLSKSDNAYNVVCVWITLLLLHYIFVCLLVKATRV